MRLSTCVTMLALFSAPASASAGEPTAVRPLAEVLREAARLRRPILLDFSTVW